MGNDPKGIDTISMGSERWRSQQIAAESFVQGIKAT